MVTIETLNNKFGIANKATFYKGKGGLICLAVNTAPAAADISLYGAQLQSYAPAGQKEMIWMSAKSLFEEGKAIRGGVPLCFPWFGPHPDKAKPQHGFARLQYWDILKVEERAEETIVVQLGLKPSTASMEMWPFQFEATATFSIGKTLDVKLSVDNTGNQAFEYSGALHTYFNISNIDSIAIEGLQGTTYYDGFGTEVKTQNPQLLYFNTETNRRYINSTGDCIIIDKEYNRKIHVAKTGSKVTVVWNPGEDVAKTIGDMQPEGYKTFVCVEPANAYTGIDTIALNPGQSHTLATTIKLVD